MPSSNPLKQTAPNRWVRLAVLLFCAVVAYVVASFVRYPSEQHRNYANFIIATLFALGLALWFFLLAGFNWRVRFRGLLIGGLALLLAMILVKVEGVDGNLFPILRSRWDSPPVVTLPGQAEKAQSIPVVPGAADFPQFLGPNRNGVLDGPNLAKDWTAEPPKEIWRIPVGKAWTGFAVSSGLAITQEQHEVFETVAAYELATGKAVWSHEDPGKYESLLAGVGPRANPLIHEGRVYTMGALGLLNCLELTTGKVLWSRDLIKDFQGTLLEWGQSSSPLIYEDKLIVSAGGVEGKSLVALKQSDGSTVWTGGNDKGAYASPVVAEICGTRQILLFGSSAMFGHDAATGKVLWQAPWSRSHPHVCNPVLLGGDEFIISSGYGEGSARMKISKDAAGAFSSEEIWKTNKMKAKFTNLIVKNSFLYGLDDGVFCCVNILDGEEEWRDGKYGHGQILQVGEIFLVMAESGEVVMLEPNKKELKELTRFRALNRKTWNPPALAGEYLLVRNDEEAACYRLPLAK